MNPTWRISSVESLWSQSWRLFLKFLAACTRCRCQRWLPLALRDSRRWTYECADTLELPNFHPMEITTISVTLNPLRYRLVFAVRVE
jgi:hypothetical protein